MSCSRPQQHDPSASDISSLPPETLSAIFVYVPTPDLIFNVSHVCRHWRALALPLIPQNPFMPHYVLPPAPARLLPPSSRTEDTHETDRKIAGFCGTVLTILIIVLVVSGGISYTDCKARHNKASNEELASGSTTVTSPPPAKSSDHCWVRLLAFDLSAAFLALLLGAGLLWVLVISRRTRRASESHCLLYDKGQPAV